MEERNVYQDISRRTDGDVYIGVVGPVRTGKSTFIKRFMDSLVLPNIRDEAVYRRTVDELPQSAAGRTIMTTEPKFIPEESVEINLGGNTTLNVRMIDCVGYIVNSAIGYSEESGIPYEKAIVKNSYIGRTFIKPSQKERMKSVKIKLNPIADKIKGKRVVIIDDSIVRGTTVDRIVTMLKEAGAKEVHMRIACPPLIYGCPFINFTSSKSDMELITRRLIKEFEGDENKNLEKYAQTGSPEYQRMVDTIAERLNLSSLKFNTLEDLIEAIGLPKCQVCTHCFDGSSRFTLEEDNTDE